MSYSKLLYSLFLFFSFASFTSSYSFLNNNSHIQCSAEDTHALILFKQSLFSINETFGFTRCEDPLGSGYNPIMMNWNTNTDCCNWNGVTCDDSTGDVIGLDLTCGMLYGTIFPNNTLFHLRHLQRLNLALNYFYPSQLPSEIGRFSNSLTHLNISECWFTGQVPTDITLLHKLVSLDLSWNGFDFKLKPDVLNNLFLNLTNLEQLSFEGVNISSVLPAGLNISSSLKVLNLGYTGLQGKLPDYIFKLQSLETLHLLCNSLTGDIPSEISLLPKLVSLDLSANSNLRIRPHIFNSLLINSTLLMELWLYGVNISSVLPTYINMSSLKSVELSNTNLQGTIFNLQWYGLEQLYLHSNLIQGPFPPSICNMSSLYFLDMSYNRFGGVIPQCVGNITSSVRMMNLGRNLFNGTIPNVYDNCEGLVGLILNGNQLEGEVPSSLSKCQSLKVVDLGNNQLSGTFPSWLGGLPSLQVLILKSNNFDGPIITSSPMKLPFQSLQILDLSQNEFVGQLPANYFQTFNAMKGVVKKSTRPEYLDMAGPLYSFIVTVKGLEQDFPQVFVDYTIINLSHNKFQSEIPVIVGSLNSLIVLDLSHNILTGRIPFGFGKLLEIESLDLSCNQLSGEIPQSLTDLTSLGFLNLSENQLQGHIPQGKQFDTFEGNSFIGNPKLCGLPLSHKCGDYPHKPQLQEDEDEDGEGSGFTWEVVTLGYGCGTLLGLVMGYLMLSTRKVKWFNAIADAAERMILKKKTRRHVYIRK